MSQNQTPKSARDLRLEAQAARVPNVPLQLSNGKTIMIFPKDELWSSTALLSDAIPHTMMDKRTTATTGEA